MPALRLMTFNVQCLPLVAAAVEGRSDLAALRATGICDALLAIPVRERPDVIAMNEAFDEDARSVFVRRLKSFWPHVVSKVHDGGVHDDSGLMLFSRHPFLQMPNGEMRHEVFYDDSAADDGLAQKAVCIVQIGEPIEPTTLAFTHLQAAYDTDDQHAEVRASQFRQIDEAIDTALSGQRGPRGQAIVLGDLNVRGDPEAEGTEWRDLFEGLAGPFFESFLDGWRSYMRPPGQEGRDPGHTNLDPGNDDLRQRLDYLCFARPGTADRILKPHHMRVGLRGLSDHFALEALVQLASDFCTPSEALDFLGDVPVGAGGGDGEPSTTRRQQMTFAHAGSWQWLFVGEPGTYTFFTSPHAIADCYLESDLSVPLRRTDRLHLAELPSHLRDALGEALDPRGETFAAWEPFFVALRDRDGKPGSVTIAMVKHHGESAATAIVLLPEVPLAASFPAGQRLGEYDLCWFKAIMPRTLAGAERAETFEVANPGGTGISVELKDAAFGNVTRIRGTQPRHDLSLNAKGDELFYLVIDRDDRNATGFRVTWHSPVGYLDLDQPIYLFVADETGPDPLGDDEPEMTIWIDGLRVFDGSWDDADTGEWWPALHATVRERCASLSGGRRRVGFAQDIAVTAFDPDFEAQGVFPTISLAPPGPGDPPMSKKVETMIIPDTVSDGRYVFGCSLSRFP